MSPTSVNCTQRRWWRRPRTAALLLLLTVTLTWLWAHEGHDVIPTKGVTVKGDTILLSVESRRSLDVKTTDVQRRTLERTMSAPATVVLRPEARAFATAQLGGRISFLVAKPGQSIDPTDTLAYVTSPEILRLQLERTTAQHEAEFAAQTWKRDEDLAAQGARSQRDLLLARNRRQEKANALLIAELKLQSLVTKSDAESLDWKNQPGEVPVRSPITGVVAHVDAANGMIVDPYQHLLEIVDPSRVVVHAEVPEAYAAQVKVGQTARIRLSAYPERAEPFRGVVRARERRVKAETLAESVWIEVASPPPAADNVPRFHGASPARGGLVPGMTGEARLIVESVNEALAVPEAALIRDGIETFVFVQIEPGKYERKRVVTGLKADGYVQIVSGLFSIDLVVVQGHRQLASFFIQGVLRPSPEARKNSQLRIEPVALHPIATTIDLDAVLDFDPGSRRIVSMPITGKIVEIGVSLPQQVTTGANLVRVASLDFQHLQLQMIQAELATELHGGTVSAYEAAERQQKGIVPLQFMQEAQTNLRIAQASVENYRRQLQTLGLTPGEIDAIAKRRQLMSSFWLRAPTDTYAIPQNLAIGQVVKEGTTVCVLQSERILRVKGMLYHQDLRILGGRPEARLRLTAKPDVVFEPSIERVDPTSLESGSRSRFIYGVLEDEKGDLEENMLGRLTLIFDKSPPVLAVPLTALDQDGSRWHVFVYDEAKDQFAPRQVELGRRDDLHAEILSGLKQGEKVAVSAVAELRRGYGRIK